MSTISDRIKQAMELRDLRQADIVRITGIDKGQLSSYLSGKYNPKQDNIYLIAKALNVSASWLLGYDVPMESVRNSDDIMDLVIRLDDEDRENLKKYINNMLLSQPKYQLKKDTTA